MATAEPDWALWRSFAAVVADGSLSAAARRIGYSQPTLGRHIEALEQQLGITLFDRTLQGLKPTETALRLYQSVSAAAEKLAEAALVAEGSTGDLEGTVRITASTVVSHYILPQLLRPIRDEFPAVAIEIGRRFLDKIHPVAEQILKCGRVGEMLAEQDETVLRLIRHG